MGLLSVVWATSVAYLKGSSIAGLSHAANARSVARAIYWLLLFTAGLTLTLRGLVVLVYEYWDYPVVTTNNMVAKPHLVFPAVTLCDLNRLNCYNLLKFRYELGERLDIDAFSSEDEKSEVEDLFHNLVEIELRTGCLAQSCFLMVYELPAQRDDGSDDQVVLNAAEEGVQCINHLEDLIMRSKMCYYLVTMAQYDPDVDDGTKAWANQLIEDNDCRSMDAFCPYCSQYLEVYDENNLEVGEELTSICQNHWERKRKKRSTTSSEGSEREKRQAEGGEEDPSASIFTESEFLPRYMELSEEVRSRLGHQFDTSTSNQGRREWMLQQLGMMFSCFYNGQDCSDPTLWRPSLSPSFGNCYTFNAANNDKDPKAPRISSLTGANNGLSLEIYIDQLNYMRGKLSQRAGIRAIVHAPDSFPQPDAAGLDVMPGTYSSMAIEQSTITRLPWPHPDDCLTRWDETTVDKTLMAEGSPRYSSSVCIRFCLQHQVMLACDCFHTQLEMSLMNVSRFEFEEEQRPCRVDYEGREDNDYQCVNDILLEYDEKDSCPWCNPACKERDYTVSVTTSLWPSNRYWTDLALALGFEQASVYDTTDGNAVRERIQQNYLKVDVYYQSLNIREIEQTAKYNLESYFAALGGGLSLYLGVAIILVFEVLELCYDIVMAVCKHSSKGSRVGGGGRWG